MTFEYADESDRGPYPIPPRAPIEGGPNADGDRHVLVVDRDRCVRLNASVSLDGLGPQAKVVARALKRYGALPADNGSPWHFSGAPYRRWDNDDLHTLDRLTGRDFEVVDTRSLRRRR